MNISRACYFSNAVYDDSLVPFKDFYDVAIKVKRYNNYAVVASSQSKKEVLIAIRGSDSIEDFLEDFEVFSVDVEGLGTIHKGFYKALLDIKEGIFVALKGLYRDGYRITCVGHSLGGAINSLLSVLLSKEYPEAPIELITLGSPKVGFKNFKKIFDASGVVHTRLVNENDIVAQLPRSFTSYTHVGTLKPIGKRSWWNLYGSVKDHFLISYLRNIPKDL